LNRELPAAPGAGLLTTASSAPKSNLRYRFVDLGTLGGPSSYFAFTTPRDLNNHGDAAGGAETSTPDPFAPNCLYPECYVGHGFLTDGGGLQDLGTLQDSSGAGTVNENGAVAMDSENGAIDPFTGFPEFRAVLWEGGTLSDLGTFGGYVTYTNDMNNGDQLAGFSTNGVSDPYPLGNYCQNFPMGEQMHAFVSRGAVPKDIGTLGGPDSCGTFVNQSGDVAGQSYTNNSPNGDTGFPTQDPFIYKSGKMTDLGSLGGTVAVSNGINDSGQVIGDSTLAGNTTQHGFSSKGGVLKDLGTLGGNNSSADWLNAAGDVVGTADLPGSSTHDAYLWKNGVMTDLGLQDGDPCSRAIAVNSKDQVVGGSSNCHMFLHAFLWQKGTMIDLNSFVPPSSNVVLTQATSINESGEIAVQGVLPSGDSHAVLLIPCGNGQQGCQNARRSKPRRVPTLRSSAKTPLGERMSRDRYLILDALHRSRH
jgi:probable HAF family extracellular repeat protein